MICVGIPIEDGHEIEGDDQMTKTVTVTGAAGAIGYAILFRIASGQLLGPTRR
nr:hypothetical protein [Rubrobacter tropicus]